MPARVLLVAPQPVYEDRGTPIAIRLVLMALSELGYEVDVLTYPVGADIPIPGVHWIRVGQWLGIRHVPVGLSARKILLDIPLAWQVARRVRSGRYDFVHAVEEAAFAAAWACRRTKTPLLYDMQSSIPQQLSRSPVLRWPSCQTLLRRAERWLLERADLIVASAGLGAYVRDSVVSTPVREWRYPAVGLVDPGRARAIRERLGIPEEARIVVYSGTFEEYQGLPEFVKAARRVVDARPDAVFIAVGGDPSGVARLQGLARNASLGDRFHVLGRQPREEALAFVDLADVVVSPRAHGDNLPLKIADYMAATKPIVATRIAAHTVVLDPTRAMLTETDGESLARGILAVLEDAATSERLAYAAKAYRDEHFGWSMFRDSVREHCDALVRPVAG